MRTLSGNPSAWRRMECNEPLPPNPAWISASAAWMAAAGRLCCAIRPAIAASPSSASRIPRAGAKATPSTSNGAAPAVVDPGPDRGPGPGRDDGPRGGPGRDDGFRGGPDGRWNDEIRFTGRGDGDFNNFRGPDDRLYDCEVTVDRRGQVTVTFQNDRRSRSTFTGQLTRFDRDLIVADMSGRGVRGSMEIRLNGRDRVTDISMSATGRERFELRWHR